MPVLPLANLFSMGGPLFMSLITLVALLLLAAIVFTVLADTPERAAARRGAVVQASLLAAALGLFAQILGLYQMMSVVEQMGGAVSPALLAGGLKVSFIAPLYGLLVCAAGLLAAAVLALRAPRAA